MNPILRQRHTRSYILALALTLVSFWLAAADHAAHLGASGHMIWALVLVIAGIKIRLVLMDFMELRSAPLGLRISFEAFLGGIAVTLILLDLLV
ncbi:MAG: cytochrome C oxidase subunit IV family protein [Aeromicrobium sp.]